MLARTKVSEGKPADFGSLIWLIGGAILGALAIIFAPRASARAVELGRQQPVQAFGVGLLVLFSVPLMVVLIAFVFIRGFKVDLGTVRADT